STNDKVIIGSTDGEVNWKSFEPAKTFFD
ncbi:unnamed protein product, partial [Rotaria magnacalcarata]